MSEFCHYYQQRILQCLKLKKLKKVFTTNSLLNFLFPICVDPVDFGQWYEDNVDEEFTLGALQLHTSVERETIDSE